MGFIGKIIGTVVSIALAVGAYFLFAEFQEKAAEADSPEVGDCLKLTGSASYADHEEVGCGDPEATYEVVADAGGCDKVEVNYTITLEGGDEGNVADLCLTLNASEGDCFRGGGPTTQDVRVDCASTKGDPTVEKVVAVVDSASGDCPRGAKPLRNKTRDTLICMSANS